MTNEQLILIIEDDELVARTVSRTLVRQNYKVRHVNNGVEGLQVAREYSPDLIILDVVMQGMDGYNICREIRQDPLIKDTPVMFLTAKIKDDDRVTGLRAGADDYLTKPFNIEELALRVQAILRRFASPQPNQGSAVESVQANHTVSSVEVNGQREAVEVKAGDYILDTRSFELDTPKMGKVLLTPIQYQLVYYLINHTDVIFSPSRLLEEVWNFPPDTGSPDLVRVHVKNLRKRVEEDPTNPQFIQTVPGYGYTIKSLAA